MIEDKWNMLNLKKKKKRLLLESYWCLHVAFCHMQDPPKNNLI